jgi:hypothetical protein
MFFRADGRQSTAANLKRAREVAAEPILGGDIEQEKRARLQPG